jgi:hypothetical protein
MSRSEERSSGAVVASALTDGNTNTLQSVFCLPGCACVEVWQEIARLWLQLNGERKGV